MEQIIEKKERKKGSGGKRLGAGRKQKADKKYRLQVWVSKSKIYELAQDNTLPLNEAIVKAQKYFQNVVE